jgi:hypothetical protein
MLATIRPSEATTATVDGAAEGGEVGAGDERYRRQAEDQGAGQDGGLGNRRAPVPGGPEHQRQEDDRLGDDGKAEAEVLAAE